MIFISSTLSTVDTRKHNVEENVNVFWGRRCAVKRRDSDTLGTGAKTACAELNFGKAAAHPASRAHLLRVEIRSDRSFDRLALSKSSQILLLDCRARRRRNSISQKRSVGEHLKRQYSGCGAASPRTIKNDTFALLWQSAKCQVSYYVCREWGQKLRVIVRIRVLIVWLPHADTIRQSRGKVQCTNTKAIREFRLASRHHAQFDILEFGDSL